MGASYPNRVYWYHNQHWYNLRDWLTTSTLQTKVGFCHKEGICNRWSRGPHKRPSDWMSNVLVTEFDGRYSTLKQKNTSTTFILNSVYLQYLKNISQTSGLLIINVEKQNWIYSVVQLLSHITLGMCQQQLYCNFFAGWSWNYFGIPLVY